MLKIENIGNFLPMKALLCSPLGGFCIKILFAGPPAAGPFMMISGDSLFRGAVAGRSWSRSRILCEILSRYWWRSWWNMVKSSLQSPVVRRSCEDPVEIFKKSSKLRSCRIPWNYQSSGILMGGSCRILWDPLLYIEGPSLTIFWNFLRSPGMRFWFEVLMT